MLPKLGSMQTHTVPAHTAVAIVQACDVLQELLVPAQNAEECHVRIGRRPIHIALVTVLSRASRAAVKRQAGRQRGKRRIPSKV